MVLRLRSLVNGDGPRTNDVDMRGVFFSVTLDVL